MLYLAYDIQIGKHFIVKYSRVIKKLSVVVIVYYRSSESVGVVWFSIMQICFHKECATALVHRVAAMVRTYRTLCGHQFMCIFVCGQSSVQMQMEVRGVDYDWGQCKDSQQKHFCGLCCRLILFLLCLSSEIVLSIGFMTACQSYIAWRPKHLAIMRQVQSPETK